MRVGFEFCLLTLAQDIAPMEEIEERLEEATAILVAFVDVEQQAGISVTPPSA